MDKQSSKIQMQAGFDYQALDANSRTLVQKSTQTIKACLRRTAKDIWKVGQSLAQVRSCLQYGQFVAWLDAEFEWTSRTAYNFIHVFEAFPDLEKFSKLDAATSALYLLASPATPPEIRDEFLKRATSGERITHKNVQKAIQASKTTDAAAPSQAEKAQPAEPTLEIVSLIPRDESSEAANKSKQPLSTSPNTPISIHPGWYLIQAQHYLFCGDTASSKFSQHIPSAALALAITSDDWDHDWLIEQASTILILEEAAADEKPLKQLLQLLSKPGEIVIFPYLPIPGLLAIGHQLKRKLYLGDANPRRCTRVIKQAGLDVQRLSS